MKQNLKVQKKLYDMLLFSIKSKSQKKNNILIREVDHDVVSKTQRNPREMLENMIQECGDFWWRHNELDKE